MFPQTKEELMVYAAFVAGVLLLPVTLPMHAAATAYHAARGQRRPPGGWGFGETETEAHARRERERVKAEAGETGERL